MEMSDLKIPETGEELQEFLADQRKVGAVFSAAAVNDGTAKKFLDAHAAIRHAKDAEVAAQQREQMQLVLAEFLSNSGGRSGPPVGLSPNGPTLNGKDLRKVSTGRGAVYNKAAPGARLGIDEVFDNSAEFFQAIWPRMNAVLKNRKELGTKLHRYNDIQTDIRNSFASEVPADGGFLIPATLRAELLEVSLV